MSKMHILSKKAETKLTFVPLCFLFPFPFFLLRPVDRVRSCWAPSSFAFAVERRDMAVRDTVRPRAGRRTGAPPEVRET